MRTPRIAVRNGRSRAVAEWHAMRGDPAAALLGVRQRRDPFPYYERLRARGELHRSPTGFHCTASHRMVRTVLTDNRFGMPQPPPVSRWSVAPGDERLLAHPVEHTLLVADPPVHTELRKLIARWFTARAVRERESRIRLLVAEVFEKLTGQDEFDYASAVAARVPLEVICDLLGVPIEDHDRFVWWGTVLSSTIDGPRTLRERRDVRAALGEMNALFGELVERYRREPADNLISALVASDLGRRDLMALAELVFVAGLETTANLLGDTVRLLLAHPDQWAALVADPGLAPTASEEVLRFDPPTKYTARRALSDVELDGQVVPAGGLVFNFLAGANRDPRVFTDPDVFDIGRRNARENVSFSTGIHHCIGAGLARLEAEVTLREVVARYPNLASAGPAKIRLARSVRGPYQLPVRV